MPKNTIYVLTCLVTGKRYVGQTWQDPKKRFQKHKSDARNYVDYSVKLCAAIRKYGEDSFYLSVLEEADSQEEADRLEALYIEKLNTISEGYNLRAGGSKGRCSAETVKRMSKAKLGEKNSFFGRSHTNATKAKLRAARLARHELGPIKHPALKGSQQGGAKLTEALVVDIRHDLRAGKSYKALAETHHVSKTTIALIAQGKSWKHVTIE